jgi:hypothetical protein
VAIKVADTFIAVGGDLTGYRKSLADAKTETMSLGAQLRQAFTSPGSFGGSSRLAGFVADLKNGHTRMDALRTLTTGLGGDLKRTFSAGVTSALHGSLNGIKGVLGGIKGLASDIFKGFSIGLGIGSFQALGRVLSDLVNVIPDLIQRGRDYGRTVDDIADATGGSTEQASKFTSTLLFLGQTTGGVINMIGQMSRNLGEQEPILNKLGIATRDVNGVFFNQLQILENARQAMSTWGRGTVQADQIAREFGRGGLRTLVDYLQLTDEQFEKITEDARRSGLILTDAQRDLGESMIREEARFQNALTGLGQTIFTVVGPQIRAFFSNLSDWIQSHVTEISNAISNAISFIMGLVAALTGVSTSLDSFSGSIQAGNAILSPYGTQLIQLRLELGELELQKKSTAGATDALRESITRQIQAIEDEIEVLRRQEKAQDTVFRRAIAGFARVYQLRLDALALAERERENLERQRDLNEQLNEAQLRLIEAQRGEIKAGKVVVDAEDVASAMKQIADIQHRQEEAARDEQIAGQKASLEATRDYIESIGQLLEDAENKRAALNTLRRREDVLNARLQDQIAAGDIEGAADTQARLEAIKTAIVRAEEQARSQEREDSLERQKELLQRERAAIKNVVEDTTAIRKAELRKQIADLEAQEAAFEKLTDKQKQDLLGVTDALTGEGGLTAAMTEARDAGVKFGEDVKAALAGLGDLFGGIVDLLADIKGGLDEIGRSDVWKFLTEPVNLNTPSAPNFINPRPVNDAVGKGLTDIVGELLGWIKRNPGAAGVYKTPTRQQGGYVDEGMYWLHDREYVVDRSLTEKLERFFSGARMPDLVAAGAGGGSVGPHSHDIYMDGQKVADATMPRIERRIADTRRF